MNGIEAFGLGELFAQLRSRAGFTQEELAEKADLSVRGLRNIELGHVARPRPRTVAALVDALDVDESELLLIERHLRAAAPARAVTTLPSPPVHFVGRADVLDQLTRRIAGAAGGSPVLIVGPAGIGKTASAVHVAHRLRDSFPGGQLFLSLSRESDDRAILRHILRLLGVSGRDIPDRSAEQLADYQSILRERRVLVLADNATSSQMHMLAPMHRGSALVVTSRVTLALPHAALQVVLPPLDQDEGLELLAGLLGPDRVHREVIDARRIVDFCEGLPLALRMAGGRLIAHEYRSLAWLARRLTDERRRLSELAVDDVGLRAGLTSTYSVLSGRARELFAQLGQLDTEYGGDRIARALAGLPRDQHRALVEELVAAHLIEPAPVWPGTPQRFTMRALVHAFASEVGRPLPAKGA